MGALTEMWKKVDALAAREQMPVWCCWLRASYHDGYALYRAPTREEAIAKFKDECAVDGEVACDVATEEQVAEWRATMVKPGPDMEVRFQRMGFMDSPRLKREEI